MHNKNIMCIFVPNERIYNSTLRTDCFEHYNRCNDKLYISCLIYTERETQKITEMKENGLYEEYCDHFPMAQGYRELNYKEWLENELLKLREEVNKNCNAPAKN